MKYVSLIGADRKFLHKIKPFLISKKRKIRYMMINTVNYERLRNSEAVFLDGRLTFKLKEELVIFCLENSIELFFIPSVTEIGIKKRDFNINDLLIRKLSKFRLSLFQRIIKRIFDLTFSILFIIIFSPLMIFIYFLIKIIDGSPAVYMQKRLTYRGKEFVLYKFRTMVLNAESESGAVLSVENDDRITKTGKILRKTRLDEILQIFNVLSGDMSVVGPRPERKFFVEKFQKENPFYKYRFQVKAGITGLAQINCYYRSAYEDKLYFDLLYIANYSLWNDFKLILKTLFIFFKKNSARGINNEDLETFLERRGKRMVVVETGIFELRDIDEKSTY